MVEPVSVGQALREAGDETRWRAEHGRIVNGLATGFTDLDEATWGLRPGRMSLFAGEPDSGTDGIARGAAIHTVISEQRRVLWLDLHDDAVDVARLLIANRANLPVEKLRTGALTPLEWVRHDQVLDDFDLHPELDADVQPTLGDFPPQVEPLRLVCTRELDATAASDAIRAMPSASLVVLNGYDRLVHNTRARSEHDAVMVVLDQLEAASADTGAHLMVLLSLGGWRGADTRLRRRDFGHHAHTELLRRAGVAGALHRDELHFEDTPDRGIAELSLLRNEAGDRGTVRLAWVEPLRKMANLATGGARPPR